jgi:molecular chaperone Hsp33
MQDHLVRVMSQDGTLRASAALTTNMVEQMRQRQGTDPAATVALGRLITGAALLGSQLKDDQRLLLTVEGIGPLQKLHAEADAGGHVRASVKNPVSGLPLREGRLDVAGAVGRAGFLHVVKDLGLREPYRGSVLLHTSEIAEDLAWYLTTSEQIPSSVALGVYLERDGEVSASGGFLVQAMPGGHDSLIALVEERIKELPPTTTLLREGRSPEKILEVLFEGIPFGEKARTDLVFRCTCSRPQVAGMLRALGRDELQELIVREEETSVTCEFCKETYAFTRAELKEMVR